MINVYFKKRLNTYWLRIRRQRELAIHVSFQCVIFVHRDSEAIIGAQKLREIHANGWSLVFELA